MLMLTSCDSQTQTSEKKQKIEKPPAENISAVFKLKYTSGIQAIFEDSKGNFWFGSHLEGVCLFDGKTVTYFTIDDGLSDNQIRSIQEDTNGNIWFGTGNGVSSYNGSKITNHTKRSVLPIDTFSKEEWALTDNDLWFNAGNKGGIYRYDGKRLTYLSLPIPKNNDSFNLNSVTGFSRSNNGNIWIATYTAVFGYDGKSIEIIDDKKLGFIEKSQKLHVRSILEDSKGNLWIGNNGIGVLLQTEASTINFSAKNGSIGFLNPQKSLLTTEGLPAHVFEIAEDKDGNIWFGDRDTGAWKYDGTKMTQYTIEDGLTSNFVQVIYADQKGKLWFGMDDGGLCLFTGKSFERVF